MTALVMHQLRLRAHEDTRERTSTDPVIRHCNPSSTSDKGSLAYILWPSDADQERQRSHLMVSARRVRRRFCTVEGCTKRAKLYQRCWGHGGSVQCKAKDCTNRAKTKGLCWSHGGGKLCSVGKCHTIAISNGICWAHGGGKRCQIPGCDRPAYANEESLCKRHLQSTQQELS